MNCYLWNLSDEFVLDHFDNAIKYFPHNLDFCRWGYWIQRLFSEENCTGNANNDGNNSW
jgi:hypothetical protein